MRTVAFSGDKLKRARELRLRTVADVASSLQVSPQAVYKWERGAPPRPEALVSLAQELDVHVGFLLSPPVADEPRPLFFRSRKSTARSLRSAASARFECIADVTNAIEQRLTLPPYKLPIEVGRPPNVQAIESLSGAVRAGLGLGPRDPVPHMISALERMGIVTTRLGLNATSIDAFSSCRGGRGYVVLSSDKKGFARSRFDAAHELGHLVMHMRDVPPDFIDDDELFKALETEADRFAGAFLLPAEGFRADLPRLENLDQLVPLKAKWGASVGAMISRAKQLGMISDSTARWFWIQMSRRGWRTTEPLDAQLQPEQPALLRAAFEFARTHDFSPHRSLGLKTGEIEELCCLPPGFLEPGAAAPLVTFALKGSPTV